MKAVSDGPNAHFSSHWNVERRGNFVDVALGKLAHAWRFQPSAVFDATEARALGFVSRVVPSEMLDSETQALASVLAQRPAFVLSVTKRHVDAVTDAAYPTGGAFADAALTAAAIQEPESMEATARYMARRATRGKL